MSYRENPYKYMLAHGWDAFSNQWQKIAADHYGHLIVHTIMENRIHDGAAFATGHYNGAVANNGTIEILVQNSEEELVTLLEWACGGDALMTVFEGVTVTSQGTTLDWVNLNRTSANTLDSIDVFHTPTISDYGTTIYQKYTPGGGFFGSGGKGSVPEGIFNVTDDYVVRVQNISGTTQPMQMILQSYQHSHTGYNGA